VFLNNAPIEAPTKWFHGQVIDMLYFPLFHFRWPDWVPLRGGSYFEFFSPVFNIADSSIFIGVVTILMSQKKFFKEELPTEETTEIEEASEISVSKIDTEEVPPSQEINTPRTSGE
jgi:signal peptidase II